MSVDATMVKKLRNMTGQGIMDCKKALMESEGNYDKAVEYLRKKGLDTATKKVGRETSEGRIGTYMHFNGKIGVLVELNCETDFVAKGDEFQDLLKKICMHIAGAKPTYVSKENVPENVIEKEKDIYKTQMKDKPAHVIDKIIEGKLGKFYKENCLLDQLFIGETESKKTIAEMLKEYISKLGENIKVSRFARFEVGETELDE